MKYKVLTLVGLIVIVLLAATATAQNGSVTTGKTELKDADNLNVSENNVTAGKIRAVTSAMNFQGYLTDNAGVAINGNANITFTIWTALSGVSQVWSSGSQSVNIENGIFSIVLNVADSVFETGDDRWLQLNVEGEVLSPRVQITSVGYAYNAEKFDGHQWSDVQGGLSLPYSGSYSGSADAFEIEHAGEAGAVARFNSSNTSNSQPAVVIENQGSDPALYILNNNSQADEAVRIDNASNDDGFKW
jgi:hypothetical protein